MKRELKNKGVMVLIILGCLFCILYIAFCNKKMFGTQEKESVACAEHQLVVYTPHPTEFIKPLLQEYERKYNIEVQLVQGGSGELLEQIDREADKPVADVMWGGSFFTVSPYVDLFAEYTTVNEDSVQISFQNREGNMTRFTDVPSVIMVNTDLIGEIQIQGYEDLLQPELKGRIAFADPATSSSSFEQLINMLYACGDGEPEKGWSYVQALCENLQGKLLTSSSAVYRGVADGEYLVGLTFEEAAATLLKNGKHVDIIYMKEGVVSTPDGIYLVKNAPHEEEAKQFMDFLTSYQAQYVITQNLGRRSVRSDVPEPAGLPEKKELSMVYVNEKEVTEKRKEWIQHFEDIYQQTKQEVSP